MARFILTNNSDKHQIQSKRFIDADLQLVDSIEKDYYFSSYKRGDIKEKNIFILENGDFVSVVGSVVFNERIGIEALKEIYRFYDGDFQKLQKKCIGQYCIVVMKSGLLNVICDKYNIYKIYYYHINGEFFISNSLDSVCRSLDKKTLRVFALLEDSIQRGVIGKEMFYQNVYRLFGNEKISICTNEFRIGAVDHIREYYDHEIDDKSIDHISDVLAAFIAKNAQLLKNVFKSISIQTTGGMDSRLLLASFINQHYKPKLLYGVGDSPITNTYDKDREIVGQLGKTFDLDVKIMDWGSEGYNQKVNLDYYFNKYGFNYATHYCTKNHFIELEQNINNWGQLSMNGLFGENFKIREWAIKKKKSHFSLDEIINEYHLVSGFYWKSDKKKSEYSKYLKSEMVSLNNSTYNVPIDGEYVSINHFEEWRSMISRTMDGHEINLINEFIYYLNPLAIIDTYEYTMSVPWRHKLGQNLAVSVLKKLSPNIMDIPVFSHTQVHLLKDGSLIVKKKTSEIIKNKIRKYIPKSILRLKQRVVHDYLLKSQSNQDVEMYNFYIKLLNQHDFIKDMFDLDKYDGDVRPLIMLVLYMHGIEEIGYDELVYE